MRDETCHRSHEQRSQERTVKSSAKADSNILHESLSSIIWSTSKTKPPGERKKATRRGGRYLLIHHQGAKAQRNMGKTLCTLEQIELLRRHLPELDKLLAASQ